jgi:amidase
MVAELAKRYLGREGVVVADGVHDRLRETAATYLSQR